MALILFVGCADAVDYKLVNHEVIYGFWSGMWHGMIVAFSFIGSLFDRTISVYAVNNSGPMYDFGFALGTGQLLSLLLNFHSKDS